MHVHLISTCIWSDIWSIHIEHMEQGDWPHGGFRCVAESTLAGFTRAESHVTMNHHVTDVPSYLYHRCHVQGLRRRPFAALLGDTPLKAYSILVTAS